jgi:signal transduction histidine kinase
MLNALLNNRVPVFVKIMAPLVILILVTIGLSIYFVYRETASRLSSDLDVRLQQVPAVIARAFDEGGLPPMPPRPDDPAYANIQDQLEEARAAANLDRLAVYYRQGDQLFYWVGDEKTRPGDPFPYTTPQHLAVYGDQHPRFVRYNTPDGGARYGFVVPVMDTTSDPPWPVVGLVEATVNEETRSLVGRRTLGLVLPSLTAGIVVAVGLSLFLTYLMFNRRLRRLQQGALTLASGQLGHVIELPGRDELGDLALAFNQMSIQIEQLYRERVDSERAQRQWEVGRLQESERILEAKVAERTAELAKRNQELTRSQAELAAARDAALEANRAKSAFLANMSHELRTPLNAIIGYSEMLQEDAQDVGLGELIPDMERIQAAGRHLLDLINDILDLSKIEAGKMNLYLEEFDIPSLVQSVADIIQPLVERNLSTLTVHYSPDIGSMVADQTKVRQILFNLLSNAAKFTEEGEITFDVTRVSQAPQSITKRDGEFSDWICFKVTDSGIGISGTQMPRIFEAFTQGDPSTTRKYGGTGLGLAISYRFCQMMGGEIVVESQVGQGSTFTVYLPAIVTNPRVSQIDQ